MFALFKKMIFDAGMPNLKPSAGSRAVCEDWYHYINKIFWNYLGGSQLFPRACVNCAAESAEMWSDALNVTPVWSTAGGSTRSFLTGRTKTKLRQHLSSTGGVQRSSGAAKTLVLWLLTVHEGGKMHLPKMQWCLWLTQSVMHICHDSISCMWSAWDRVKSELTSSP